MLNIVLCVCLVGLSLAAPYLPPVEDAATKEFEPSPNFPFDYKGYPYNYQGYPYEDNYVPEVPKFNHGFQHHVPQGFPYNYQYPNQHFYQGYQQFPYQHHHQGFQHHVPEVPTYHPVPSLPAYTKLTYLGKFSGTCDGHKDGLYYVDSRSFASCYNGQKAIQPCAGGSANPDFEEFQNGKYKYENDFCSINYSTLENILY